MKLNKLVKKKDIRDNKKIICEILAVSMQMKLEFPMVYRNLDETPIAFTHSNSQPNSTDLKHYLNTLKLQFSQLKKNN
jgi:hypothetical protein